MFDPSTLNFNSMLNKFAVCMKSLFIFWWTDMNRYEINEIGKNQEKSIKKECVIDFYGVIHRIDINQFRFTDFYRITDWQIDIDFFQNISPFLIGSNPLA